MATPAIDKEIGHANVSISPWSGFFDTLEEVPELAWPNSIETYDRIRTDMQVAAVLLAGTLPIRRYKWFIDPNGARDEIVQFVASEFGLPIQGQDPEPLARQKQRFSHDFHLRHALLALIYGVMMFEQVYRIGDDNKVHIRKLAPRMPRTISEIGVAQDGGLSYIRQYASGWVPQPGTPRKVGGNADTYGGLGSILPPLIPVDRLVAYVNDREGSNWRGRSILRPLFRHWVIKDRLLRVDALKHERNGLGVPMIEAPEGATQKMLNELSKLAQAYKAGDAAGGALPYGAKLMLVGTTGSIPDTLASIRYHDEQIAKAMLEMFMSLGTSATGSRALGEVFLEPFQLGQQAIAKTYAEITSEHVIEDLIDLNWGPDEPAPLLAFDPSEEAHVGAKELALFVDKGLVVVDAKLREYVSSTYDLPKQVDDVPAVAMEPAQPKALPPAPTPTDAALEEIAASHGQIRAAASAGGRQLRRNFTEVEMAAKFDPDTLELSYNSTIDQLVAAWQLVKAAQVEQLVSQIEAANGDLQEIALITATADGAELLTNQLVLAAQTAAEGAAAELNAQGAALTAPTITEALVAGRAKAMATVMAGSISDAARRKAMSEVGPGVDPIDAAEAVREHLNSLSDAYLRDQLGGAVAQAQSAGRLETFEGGPPVEYVASELLDRNCCEPCVHVDGTKYNTLEEAQKDYPAGIYKDCLGGMRCHGTLVAVLKDEVPATVTGNLFG